LNALNNKLIYCFSANCHLHHLILVRALTTMKQKLKGAETGHSLLKRKAEALTKRFRTITQKIDDVSSGVIWWEKEKPNHPITLIILF
jgi:hypothetical protein